MSSNFPPNAASRARLFRRHPVPAIVSQIAGFRRSVTTLQRGVAGFFLQLSEVRITVARSKPKGNPCPSANLRQFSPFSHFLNSQLRKLRLLPSRPPAQKTPSKNASKPRKKQP